MIDSGNDGHVFRGRSETLRKDVACKLIPRGNLQHGPNGEELWRNEVHKADALRSATVVKFEDIREWLNVPLKDGTTSITCIVLISEFVEGRTLRKFINEFPEEISIPFIAEWLATMLNLFNEMSVRGVVHGDLHPGNILVEDRSSYDLLGPRFVFRVTDFGVAEATSEPRFKDDYLQLADTLAQLLRAVNYQACSPRDKFVFNFLRHNFVERHLVESDLTLDPIARRPRELLTRIQDLDLEFERTAQETAQLVTPFDFQSCEQIGEAPVLLRALYSDRFLGLAEIESQNNVVLTGPRGCGKTTVFRSLSLDQKMRVGEAEPDAVRHVGIYYRCDDLYFAFPRYVAPSRGELVDVPLHFVISTLLARLLDSLERWSRKYFAEEFSRAELRTAQALWSALGINVPQVPGYATFKAIVGRLNRERSKAIERQRFGIDPERKIGRSFGPDLLHRACEALRGSFPFLRDRPIYFFIDDYSSPKVTKALQASLNRMFMQRTSICFFKLSTESPVSFARYDIDDKNYVENREFVLLNLGLIYLHSEVEPKLTFVEDVFRRRFGATQFPVKELEQLVGSNSKQNNNDLARQIREGEKPPLWGKEILGKLCSGDIHYVIGLVGDMVRLSGGTQELHGTLIAETIQNQSIRSAAGSFLKNLRGIPQCGEQLVSIVEAFGNTAQSHLKFLDSKNEKGSPPKQATRIEPYEMFELSDDARALYDELLRYSVFIEDFRGKSRRGNVVPRLFLRRFLIPHFNLTFSTRDSIEIEPHQFEIFLLNPKSFEQTLRLKSVEDARKYDKELAARDSQMLLKLAKDGEPKN
ncbi:MAG TPA: AarF/UbiB family protein [Chthoniobacterales bacterium]|nr:AarF/UbiB family protein [Chthoniobacterales bacterium]